MAGGIGSTLTAAYLEALLRPAARDARKPPEVDSGFRAAPFAAGQLQGSCSRAQSVVLGGSPAGSVSDLTVLTAEFDIGVQTAGSSGDGGSVAGS